MSVISPGTPPGSGQPSSSSFSTSITGSALNAPLERWKRKTLLAKVAPTKPCSESGSWSQRTSSGTQAGLAEIQRLHSAVAPPGPRSGAVARTAPPPRHRCRSRGSYAFGSPNSDETNTFLRGWYQKS